MTADWKAALTASFYVCVSRFLQSMDVPLEEESTHE